jgi:alkylation response protein AidB-like acyl-CoA dehydrogenase
MSLWPNYAEADFVEHVSRFVREKIIPEADRIDREDIYPTEIVRQIMLDGLTTITLPTEYGGGGRDYSYATALCEEVAYGSAATAISLITIFQAQTIINLYGSESLKQRYLPLFPKGLICSYALTEANHGSDIRTLDTKARREGDYWVITGEKAFITSGSCAEFFIILAETENGVSAFAVPGGVENLSTYIGEKSATFGLRNGPHVNLKLDGVRVPLDHLIGEDGKGVRQAVTTLDFSRTLAAAVSMGVARAAFDGALAHAAGRTAFDQKVLDFQGIQWYFAEMLSDIDSARLLVYHAARVLSTGDHFEIMRFTSEAKLKASAVATKVAAQAIQICGVYGTTINSPFGRYLRDAKTYEVGGGSAEVLKNAIARCLVRSVRSQPC